MGSILMCARPAAIKARAGAGAGAAASRGGTREGGRAAGGNLICKGGGGGDGTRGETTACDLWSRRGEAGGRW